MRTETEYEIDIPQNFANTKAAFKTLIEEHYQLFETSVMSAHAGDMRYSYMGDSFTVTEIEPPEDGQGSFTFEVMVQYYEGCKGKDGVDPIEETVAFSFDKESRSIKFTLDETQWGLDN